VSNNDDLQDAYRRIHSHASAQDALRVSHCQLPSCGKQFEGAKNPRHIRITYDGQYRRTLVICRYHTTDDAAEKGENI
jgi:hypothetical protein